MLYLLAMRNLKAVKPIAFTLAALFAAVCFLCSCTQLPFSKENSAASETAAELQTDSEVTAKPAPSAHLEEEKVNTAKPADSAVSSDRPEPDASEATVSAAADYELTSPQDPGTENQYDSLESAAENQTETVSEDVDIGIGPGPAADDAGNTWSPGTIIAPGVSLEDSEEAVPDSWLTAESPSSELSTGISYIDIGEGPEEAEVPIEGEIPTAASFTIFNEDHSISSVVPEPASPYEYLRWDSCRIEDGEVVLNGALEGSITPSNTAMGADTNFYLLELELWEDSIEGHRFTASIPKNAADLSFRLPLGHGTEDDRLYRKFVACIWAGDHYIPVSEQVCVTNPEDIAEYTLPYTEPMSKKGLLIEKPQISDAFELGVCNVIINIPFNHLLGEGIDYEYDGQVWHFNRNIVETYDLTISAFSNKSMNVSVVLLNGFNQSAPEFFYPGTQQNSTAKYYQFNASTREGCDAIKAVASFLAMRYNGLDGDHGKVQNWIIGNEINNQEWNWLGPMAMTDYIREYERCFRLFYNAIRSTCANDRVFFSLDHNWNREANGRTRYPARDVLIELSDQISRRGNIDWGLAYHPYSEPMTEPEFWDDFNTGQVTYYDDSPVVNFANISLLTDYMQRPEMRDRQGHVRHIILSEEGFTSMSATRGEVQMLQAAAFAYAYYIADSNLYIDSFILSRQVDAPSELRSSLAFGLWTTSSITDANIQPSQKKYIWEVFKNIDRRSTTLEYSAFAKEILGIERWSDVIPGFRWARYEK